MHRVLIFPATGVIESGKGTKISDKNWRSVKSR